MKFKVGDLVEYWSFMDLRIGRRPRKGIVLEGTPRGTYKVYMLRSQEVMECRASVGTKLSLIRPQEAQNEV